MYCLCAKSSIDSLMWIIYSVDKRTWHFSCKNQSSSFLCTFSNFVLYFFVLIKKKMFSDVVKHMLLKNIHVYSLAILELIELQIFFHPLFSSGNFSEIFLNPKCHICKSACQVWSFHFEVHLEKPVFKWKINLKSNSHALANEKKKLMLQVCAQVHFLLKKVKDWRESVKKS